MLFLRHTPDDMRNREKVSSSTTCEDGDTANHSEGECGWSPALISNNDKQHTQRGRIVLTFDNCVCCKGGGAVTRTSHTVKCIYHVPLMGMIENQIAIIHNIALLRRYMQQIHTLHS